jgi:hypothetical protein
LDVAKLTSTASVVACDSLTVKTMLLVPASPSITVTSLID